MTEDARPREEAPHGPPLASGEGADLLSIGLLAFFVALLLVVLALLAFPLVAG